ncbi:M48 family metallopeptidase [Kangiella sp.]|uniref:M48 family metallopeptidase n=1 Tax=Kangiella sp. TaxID=1920245 RepID=UPI003A8D2F6E
MTTPSETGLFTYGDNTIQYHVIRKLAPCDGVIKSNRKVTIKVYPDQKVTASAPFDASEELIRKAVLKRARWIWQSIETFAKQKDTVKPKHYVSGETQFYLGKRYVLKVLVDTDQTNNVKLNRGQLQVTFQQDHEERAKKVKELVDQWYKNKAQALFQQRLTEVLKKTTWVADIPSFRVMEMKKQWGSCSAKGQLVLNPHLIKAPKECIDYVILHELCHIAEYNHSERFWRLLTQVMPNWKEVKAKLDGMAEMYLND